MKRWLVIAIAVAACGKSSDKPRGDDNKVAEPVDSDAPPHTSTKELVAAKLESVASTAQGHAFTVDLPASLLKKPEVKGAYATWSPKKEWFDSPSFTVQYSDIPLIDGSTGMDKPIGQDADQRKIVRAEKLPDGGYLNIDQRTDHAFVLVEVCRPAPGGSMCCHVTQRVDDRKKETIEDFDQAVALYTKICTSMKPGA